MGEEIVKRTIDQTGADLTLSVSSASGKVPRHVTMSRLVRRDQGAGFGPEGRIEGDSPSLPGHARLGLLGLAFGLTVLLATAGNLTPDPRGFGTHEQLGRAPCAILNRSGRLCPTCGMTTAYAWFVRGDLARAWQSNPAGLAIAALSVPMIPWLVVASVTRRLPGVRSVGESLAGLAVVAAVLAVLTWIVRRSLLLI